MWYRILRVRCSYFHLVKIMSALAFRLMRYTMNLLTVTPSGSQHLHPDIVCILLICYHWYGSVWRRGQYSVSWLLVSDINIISRYNAHYNAVSMPRMRSAYSIREPMLHVMPLLMFTGSTIFRHFIQVLV